MTTHKLLLAGFATASALAIAGASHAAIIAQTENGAGASSGAGNYGQQFQVTSSLLTENILTAFSLTKGNGGGGHVTNYIDVYGLGTATEIDVDFGTLDQVSNLDYLGSSTNFVNTDFGNGGAADNASLVWTFANITLPFDTPIFLVHSSDGVAGSFLGTSTRVEGAPEPGEYTNITGAESFTLAFAGDVSDAQAITTDNKYTVTLVPEPSSLALLSLGGLLIARRRRD